MERLIQMLNIESAFPPVDMSTAANNGDWINLKLYGEALFVLFKAAGTSGQDPVFTLEQAQDAAGTGAKALNFSTIYKKVGTLTGVAEFTRATQAAANTYTDDVSAEAQAIMVVDVGAAELDIANGFTFARLNIPDVGAAAQLGCAFVILGYPRFMQQILSDAKV